MFANEISRCVWAVLICGFAGLVACDVEAPQIDDVAEPGAAVTPQTPAPRGETVDPELEQAMLEIVAEPTEIRMPPIAYELPDELDDLYIESIATGGTGCPDPHTVTPVIASDRKSFLLIFDDMHLQYPPGNTVQNVTCSAGVKLHIPNGYQMALATVNTRGYAYLDQGIRARHTSKYFFAGNPIAFAPHASLKGYFDDLYDFTDFVPFESLVWSPCGGSAIFGIQSILNLNAVFNPHGQAIISNDTIDGRFQQVYHLLWQEC